MAETAAISASVPGSPASISSSASALAARGAAYVHLSISHDGGFALAFVVLEG